MAKERCFSKEVDLCAAFISAIERRKLQWTVYAETGGWDILLVRKDDGFQIGVEAKLKLNAEVVGQTLEERAWYVDGPGPDCRAILVPPEQSNWYGAIAAYIGITVIRLDRPDRNGRFAFSPRLPDEADHYSVESWHEWAPAKRIKLPEYIPDVAAGAPSPVQLTQWKIGALRLTALLEKNGFLTRDDFKTCKVDHRRWISKQTGWLKVKDGYMIAGDCFPKVARQHPVVYEQIKAEIAKLAPKAKQGSLSL